jgi:hypothetical protein
MKPTNSSAHAPPSSIEKRLRRIESRLVQLMIHMGLNPYSKQYDGDEAPAVPRREKNEQNDGNSHE